MPSRRGDIDVNALVSCILLAAESIDALMPSAICHMGCEGFCQYSISLGSVVVKVMSLGVVPKA
jgi:hypothetical protein